MILVTGCAGFIGARTTEYLLAQGRHVVGIDNMNTYYDVRLKQSRLAPLRAHKRFVFKKIDIESSSGIAALFKKYRFSAVVNLAARAGVRYSLDNPRIYMTTNALGTLNLLEACKKFRVHTYILASTSSLYAGACMPFREDTSAATPISPYAASKKSAESLCYTYHYLYGINVSVLRYFTVYGPAGRPDMCVFRFIEWIRRGEPVQLYGDGNQSRDFTYIDDIAAGTAAALHLRGHEIINLGGHQPHTILHVISLIERCLNTKARIKRAASNRADVAATYADISKAKKMLNWQPRISLRAGIARTVAWHEAYARTQKAR